MLGPALFAILEKDMTTAPCPLCHSDVIVDDEAYDHDLVTCVNCNADLEIVSMTPLTLEALEETASEEGPAA